MAGLSQNVVSQLLSKTPLLITESEQEFSALSAALTQEFKPGGIVARMYLGDIAFLNWEILRLRRCQVATVNMAFRKALSSLAYRFANEPGIDEARQKKAGAVARDWFSKPEVRKEFLQLLKQFHLDESAIEAEAIRMCFSEIEILDKMITLLESRRNKALRSLAEYRDGCAKSARDVSNLVIEGERVVRLKSKRSA